MAKQGKRARPVQSRTWQLYQAVRELLFSDWDPIGVNGQGPDDEYDSYAPGVARMLQAGADEAKLAAHLRQVQTNAMGRTRGDDEHSRRIARRLRALV